MCQTDQERSFSADDDTTLFELYHVLLVENTEDVEYFRFGLRICVGRVGAVGLSRR